MGMIMVKRDWASDSKAADEAFRRVKENNSPLWLVSYLEGTRVSDKKIAEVRLRLGLGIMRAYLVYRVKPLQKRGIYQYSIIYCYREQEVS